jgi:hypothetical protein
MRTGRPYSGDRGQWQRTDVNHATRINHLTGSQGGGLSGNYWLNAVTVHDDGVADELFSEARADWFLYVLSGASRRPERSGTGDAFLVL